MTIYNRKFIIFIEQITLVYVKIIIVGML